MAIPSHLAPSSLDFTTGQYEEDYSDVFVQVTQPRGYLVLYDKIPKRRPVRSQTFKANEDLEASRIVQLNGAVSSSDTTWTLDDVSQLQNGDVLVPWQAAGKTETVKINTAPNTSNYTITVTRNLNGEGAQAFDDNTKFRVIREVAEGSGLDNVVEFVGTVERTFYTGIISHTIGLTDSAIQGKPRSYQMAELDRQEAKVLLKLKNELEDLFYFGAGVARAAGAHGQCKGIRRAIIERAGENIGTTPTRWTYKNLCAAVNWVAKNSPLDGTPDLVCFCTPDMYAAAGMWGAPLVTKSASDRTFGFETNVVHTTLGLDVTLVWSQYQLPDEFALIDMNYISAHPLGNRALKRYVMPVGIVCNDYERRKLVAEWGLVVMYADRAHWLQKNVSVR